MRRCYCCPWPSAARFGTLPGAGGRPAMQLHTAQRAPVPPCYRGSGILLGPRAFCSQVARESVVAAVHSVTWTHRGRPSRATCSPPPAQTQPNRPGALPGLCPPGGPVLRSSSHAACVRTWACGQAVRTPAPLLMAVGTRTQDLELLRAPRGCRVLLQALLYLILQPRVGGTLHPIVVSGASLPSCEHL